MCHVVVAELLFPLVQFYAETLFACCRQCVVTVVLVDQSSNTMDLS